MQHQLIVTQFPFNCKTSWKSVTHVECTSQVLNVPPVRCYHPSVSWLQQGSAAPVPTLTPSVSPLPAAVQNYSQHHRSRRRGCSSPVTRRRRCGRPMPMTPTQTKVTSSSWPISWASTRRQSSTGFTTTACVRSNSSMAQARVQWHHSCHSWGRLSQVAALTQCLLTASTACQMTVSPHQETQREPRAATAIRSCLSGSSPSSRLFR